MYNLEQRFSSDLSFRYFVNLSEVDSAGYTVNDVQVLSYYSQGATLSGLLPWDASKNIYYVNVSFAGVPIGPGAGLFYKEAQVRVGLRSGLPASAWDPTNDWSYQGLALGQNAIAATAFIPVYEHGTQMLYGQLPGPANPNAIAPAPAPIANSTDNVAVLFQVRDDWGTGFNADMTSRITAPLPFPTGPWISISPERSHPSGVR